MKTKPSHSVGLATLSYALVILSGEAVAKSIPSAESCLPHLLGNGICDKSQNTEACGYDGGDCCECTCNSTAPFGCRLGDFACVDPSAPCVNAIGATDGRDEDTWEDGRKATGLFENIKTEVRHATSTPCTEAFVSDGDCDLFNNNEDCDYDGGDCCECTCVSTEEFTCGDNYFGGFSCLDPSAPCVDDDDVTTLPEYESNPYSTSQESTTRGTCISSFFRDGACDIVNNNKDCVFDGGDCCECTCVSTEANTCGDDGGFACIDPFAPCFDDDDDDDDVVSFPESYTFTDSSDPGSTTSLPCVPGYVADGDCDPNNNNEDCGYDGGDCCEYTCVSTSDFTCGDSGGFDCIDPSSPRAEGYVEAGTKTIIVVSANTYDARPGEGNGDRGCGEDGCGPELTRDGSVDGESRWSCAQDITPDGGPCEITFAFEDAQDIMDVEVAFYRGNERLRTLQAFVNSEDAGEFDSSPAITFTALGLQGTGVETMTFTTVGLPESDWISLAEVRFLVEP